MITCPTCGKKLFPFKWGDKHYVDSKGLLVCLKDDNRNKTSTDPLY